MGGRGVGEGLGVGVNAGGGVGVALGVKMLQAREAMTIKLTAIQGLECR
jgi:hypothetical protein